MDDQLSATDLNGVGIDEIRSLLVSPFQPHSSGLNCKK